MNTRADDSCCYHCQACERPTCRDVRPSPREDDGICGDRVNGHVVEIAGTNITWRTA